MAVTIKDVAEKAGVSTSTVSRVINGSDAISNKTSEKIFKVMEELDYHPNSIARNFASGKTNIIAVVINSDDERTFSNTFFNRSLYAIETVVQDNDYNLMIVNDKLDGKYTSVEKLVLEHKVDGIILPSTNASSELIKFLEEKEFPFVILGEPECHVDETSWVDINNVLGSKMALKHLYSKDYKNVALILENNETVFAKNRLYGYKKGLEENDKEYKEDLVINCSGDTQNAYELTKASLDKNDAPDAIICSNNEIAYYVLQAIKEKELNVPNDIGVITFDNYPFSKYMTPPLSVIDVDTFSIGEKAARSLLDKISNENNKNEQILISTDLIIRESTNR